MMWRKPVLVADAKGVWRRTTFEFFVNYIALYLKILKKKIFQIGPIFYTRRKKDVIDEATKYEADRKIFFLICLHISLLIFLNFLNMIKDYLVK